MLRFGQKEDTGERKGIKEIQLILSPFSAPPLPPINSPTTALHSMQSSTYRTTQERSADETMSKFATLFVISLLLSSMLTYTAARPGPNSVGSQNQVAEIENHEENCDGVDKEECLIRRTLAAHIDYIYTQKHGLGPHKP